MRSQGPARNDAVHERAGADRAGSADSYKTDQSADPTNHRELDSEVVPVLVEFEVAVPRLMPASR